MSRPVDTHDTSPKTLFLFLGFLVFVVFYGTLLCGMWSIHFSMRGVIRNGIQTDALLEHKTIDEHNRHWFTYRFMTPFEDTYISSIEVSKIVYEQYNIGDALSMRYLPENPSLNALDILQDAIRGDVWGIVRLSGIVIGIGLVLGFGWLRQIAFRQVWQMLKR